MKWFRLYSELVNDPKIGRLSDSEFRTWIELLCLASDTAERNGDTEHTAEQADWALRRDVTVTLPRLFELGLVTEKTTESGEKTLVIANWNKRQYKSDSSSERTRKYRKNKEKLKQSPARDKGVTSQKRRGDALDTDTDTEKSKNHCASPAADAPIDEPFYLTKRQRKLKGQQLGWFEQFWEIFAYRKGKAAAADAWLDLHVTQAVVADILAGAKRTAAERTALQRAGKTPIFPQGWLSARRWEDEPEAQASGEPQEPKTDRYWRDKAQRLPGYRPDMTWTECRDLACAQGGVAA